MKFLTLLLTLLFSVETFACSKGLVRVWSKTDGYACVKRYQSPNKDCAICQGNTPDQDSAKWLDQFPKALFQNQDSPWWAVQGNLYFPNVNFPGVWARSGIDEKYYPGKGEVHALKPNIYVESIHHEKKFTFTFTSQEELSFLSTTPVLEKNTWKGKIVEKDKFEVEGVRYDYLFYDIRLPKAKMQFESGVCATREDTVNWMLKDLRVMTYPAIALQDFEEHWRVKIPDIPFFCIYPQYTKLLDEALPVSISLDQTRFTRSLYVLIGHRKEPEADTPGAVPLPILNPEEIRPVNLIKYENMFKEWGVAFLGE